MWFYSYCFQTFCKWYSGKHKVEGESIETFFSNPQLFSVALGVHLWPVHLKIPNFGPRWWKNAAIWVIANFIFVKFHNSEGPVNFYLKQELTTSMLWSTVSNALLWSRNIQCLPKVLEHRSLFHQVLCYFPLSPFTHCCLILSLSLVRELWRLEVAAMANSQ